MNVQKLNFPFSSYKDKEIVLFISLLSFLD